MHRGLTMDVEMKIRGLVMDPASNMPIVILKDVKSDTVLPIWVGCTRPMPSRWRSRSRRPRVR
jgi:bifunctional DNase/RNase